MDNISRLILEQLDIKTIRAIEKYCKNYLTFSVDFRQVLNKNGVNIKVKEVSELQEYCNFLLIMKQAEIKEEEPKKEEPKKEANANNCDNVNSTMADTTTAMSKKKEQKA